MIDFFRARVIGIDSSEYVQQSNLCFCQPFDRRTGEIKSDKLQAKKNDLTIEYHEVKGTLLLKGSLHKYWNGGSFNYNDFSLYSIIELEKTLFKDFGLKYDNLHLTRLEFGVNVRIKHEIKNVLDGCLMHRNKRNSIRDNYKGKGDYLNFKHDRYQLKIYDKGKHQNQGTGLLRFEVKHTNWTDYRKKGFTTLAQVIESALPLLMNDLLNKWNEILFFDYTNSEPSRPEFRHLLYWESLSDKTSPKFRERTTRKKNRDKLKAMNKEEGSDLQGTIAECLSNKLTKLLEQPEEGLPLSA